MLTETQIREQLTEIFQDIFPDELVLLNDETTAADVPGWDSFNHINLVVATEAHFHIKFKSAEIESLNNVGEMIVMIKRAVDGRR